MENKEVKKTFPKDSRLFEFFLKKHHLEVKKHDLVSQSWKEIFWMQLSTSSVLCASFWKRNDYLFYGLFFLFAISFLVTSLRSLNRYYFKLPWCQRKLDKIDHQIIEELKKTWS
ncbi:hypothetical protein [endosymbiont GvMRE of Glomus versiforme]|uniref:hypothetical protein n=1 Tax=endosymbiont GvMRE of Glomus versiforme TaxID=2039283 RepID=UPI000EDEFE24|nr:hypothetical protein [endosymbiont GvMRE of Glomus versiforme]RHZ35595.1 hypothetical protein GvMRE_IIg521 [endosymbiont GvMRE of Glomus versiforme]